MRLRVCTVLLLTVSLNLVPALAAQEMQILDPGADVEKPVFPTPAFDVISVKPNKSGSGMVNIRLDDGSFQATNVSTEMMILNAFAPKESQLMEVPKWVSHDPFDISAKLVDPDPEVMKKLTHRQNQEAIQPILTERFGLNYHREKKVMPIYELVVAKDGPKFAPSKLKPGTGEKGPNGMEAGNMMVNNGDLQSVAVPISTLVGLLSGNLKRVVVDKTGLTGIYDLMLKWVPGDAPAALENAAPEIFTALQEQFGLKLVASKAEVVTFVVDEIKQPVEK